ncbi:MAG TPA: 16S rRNA (adenine(1518)-N(6)/adenine(1519)-N(6))-dimethyltransferase RsmA [Candidatus Hydrogenedentes bacterium]|nr:16S rRNA (adenine(1518)-N(6)/adenine(1519)-N(6))-dimethyltransferase RsmA [Candidatus Hydrogenedentota bacterium]HQE83431.1 16S rRNA (adenine(1518)-N(6)/adenine(1519)-N(6))-dimethyltransferase RsmA [Candidatus Hydrogenedentota bacterium]HQH51102.1 16S rRNA (adenine(1518)-N(6)/adenine(1519)-N(6))-dimethyltransferase RsmA [Candidatus Hydrogenedentota bacterium]HQM47399.1 16S rRNA (adenine(1518)-N(6)/adenine(1519)-N(6))-dimethyltransferase RsmA [Candidatus Hydrogenedentota bacterium]
MHLQDLCSKYNIRFKRQLGQNLLVDDNINRIMADAANLTKEDDVIEVGAGLGALTQYLHPVAKRVLAIEIDFSFMPCLHDRFGNVENVVLFRGDVLNHGVDKLAGEFLPGGTRYHMLSNLPYYITTPVLFHFWESPLPMQQMVVMVQEEVALRLTAAVNTSDYGMLAMAARYYGEIDIVRRVSHTCFRPMPKVDSCIVRLRRHESPLYPDVDRGFLMRLMRAAFGQRRKTLCNSLTKSGNFGAPRDAVLEAMAAASIAPQRRPQTVTLDEFARLAQEIRSRLDT